MLRLDAKSFAEEAMNSEIDMARIMKRIALQQFRERFLLGRQEVSHLSEEFRCKAQRFFVHPATSFLVENWPTLLRRYGINVRDQRDVEKHVTDTCRLIRHLCRRLLALTQETTSHARDVIDANTEDDSVFEYTQDTICIGMIQDAILARMKARGICEYSSLFVPQFLKNPYVDEAIDDCLWEATDLLLPQVCRGLFTETSPGPSDLRHFRVILRDYPS